MVKEAREARSRNFSPCLLLCCEVGSQGLQSEKGPGQQRCLGPLKVGKFGQGCIKDWASGRPCFRLYPGLTAFLLRWVKWLSRAVTPTPLLGRESSSTRLTGTTRPGNAVSRTRRGSCSVQRDSARRNGPQKRRSTSSLTKVRHLVVLPWVLQNLLLNV